MTPEQYASLSESPTPQSVIGVADLVDKTPRTLIYGYTPARATFHVYLGVDGLIHVLTYNEGTAAEDSDVVPFLVQGHSAGPSGGLTDNAGYVPSKRVYPAASDFAFCKLLAQHGVQPCFTTYAPRPASSRLSIHSLLRNAGWSVSSVDTLTMMIAPGSSKVRPS